MSYDSWKQKNIEDYRKELSEDMIEELYLSFESKYKLINGSLKWADHWCERYLDNDWEALDHFDEMGIYREEALAWLVEFGYKLSKSREARDELERLIEERRRQSLAESYFDC